MAIPEPGIAQRLGQRICIELGIVAGSRNGPDIDEKTDMMGAEQADKFIDRSRRMAESPDCRWRHWHRFSVARLAGNRQRSKRKGDQSGGNFSGSTSSSRSRPFAICSVL